MNSKLSYELQKLRKSRMKMGIAEVLSMREVTLSDERENLKSEKIEVLCNLYGMNSTEILM